MSAAFVVVLWSSDVRNSSLMVKSLNTFLMNMISCTLLLFHGHFMLDAVLQSQLCCPVKVVDIIDSFLAVVVCAQIEIGESGDDIVCLFMVFE